MRSINSAQGLGAAISFNSDTGQLLELISGTVVSDWGGIGNTYAGYYGGKPSILYAKVLKKCLDQVQ